MSRMQRKLNDIKQMMMQPKDAPTASRAHRCVWKICSRPVQRPVITDHLKNALKSANKWWQGLFDTKQTKKPIMNRNKYRITDIMFNKN